jgi:hypothetical protein
MIITSGIFLAITSLTAFAVLICSKKIGFVETLLIILREIALATLTIMTLILMLKERLDIENSQIKLKKAQDIIVCSDPQSRVVVSDQSQNFQSASYYIEKTRPMGLILLGILALHVVFYTIQILLYYRRESTKKKMSEYKK